MDIVTNFDCVMIIFGKFFCVGMTVGMVMQVMLDLHAGEWVFLPCNVALAVVLLLTPHIHHNIHLVFTHNQQTHSCIHQHSVYYSLPQPAIIAWMFIDIHWHTFPPVAGVIVQEMF